MKTHVLCVHHQVLGTLIVKFNFNSIHVHVNRYWSKVNLGTCDLINIHVVVAVGVVVVVLYIES